MASNRHYFSQIFNYIIGNKIYLILFAGAISYINTLFNDFVWDDFSQIVNNQFIQSIKFLPDLFFGGTFSTNSGHLTGVYYKPILSLSYLLIYLIAGLSPLAFHLFQVALHLSNAILLFAFQVKHFPRSLALFLSLIFVVHPVNVEAVSYISALQEPLFLFFGLLALLLSTSERLTDKKLVTISILLVCSLLSKETGVLFLLVIPSWRILFKKSQIIALLGSVMGAALLYSFIRFIIAGFYLTRPETLVPIVYLSFNERLLNIPEILFFYIRTFFIPWNLAINQLWVVKEITLNNFYIPLFFDCIALILISLTCLKLSKIDHRRFTLFLFFLIWFVIGIGLHLQLIPLDLTVAERWFYFPIVGLLGMLGVVIDASFKNIKVLRKYYMIIVIIIVVTLSLRTIARNSNWRNELTLYSHDSIVLNNFENENHLGVIYLQLLQYDEAVKHFKESITLLEYRFNLYNLAITYDQTDNFTQAEEYYRKVLRKNAEPWDENPSLKSAIMPSTYRGLAKVLLFNRKEREAQEIAMQGVKEYPSEARLWIILGLSEYALHRQEAAVAAITKAVSIEADPMSQNIYESIINKQPVELVGNQNSTPTLVINPK